MIIKIRKISEYLLYLFVFLLPLQTKYILFSSEYRFEEIAIFLNFIIALALIIVFFAYIYSPFKINKKIYSIFLSVLFLDVLIFFSLFNADNFLLSLSQYIYILIAVVLFFVIIHIKINIKHLLLVFILSVFLQSIIGIGQFFTQSDFESKYLGASLQEASTLGVSVLEVDNARFLRSYGTLDHPNILAFLCLIAIIALFFVYLKYDFSFYQKQLLHIVLFSISLALLSTFSRSGIIALIGFLLILLFFLLFNFKKAEYIEMSKKLMALMLYFSLFFIIFVIILSPLLLSRLDTSSRLEAISINERLNQFDSAREIVLDNFWFGTGLKSYPYELIKNNRDLEPYQVQYVHNSFLLILAELGIFAFVSFLFILLYFFRLSFNSYYYFINLSFFWALLVFMSFDHFLWSLPFGFLLFVFVISLHFLIYKEN